MRSVALHFAVEARKLQSFDRLLSPKAVLILCSILGNEDLQVSNLSKRGFLKMGYPPKPLTL